MQRETLNIMDDKARIALVDTKLGSPADDQLLRYQFSNHLGTCALELDDSASVISYEEYYPFGSTSFQAITSAIEVSLKRYRYTGKERDEETGFYYHGARYYVPWLARWIASEPLYSEWYNVTHGHTGLNQKRDFEELTPSSYEYGYSNPIKFSDPTGEQTTNGQNTQQQGKKLSDQKINEIKNFIENLPKKDKAANNSGKTSNEIMSHIEVSHPLKTTKDKVIDAVEDKAIDKSIETFEKKQLGKITNGLLGEGTIGALKSIVSFKDNMKGLGHGDLIPSANPELAIISAASKILIAKQVTEFDIKMFQVDIKRGFDRVYNTLNTTASGERLGLSAAFISDQTMKTIENRNNTLDLEKDTLIRVPTIGVNDLPIIKEQYNYMVVFPKSNYGKTQDFFVMPTNK